MVNSIGICGKCLSSHIRYTYIHVKLLTHRYISLYYLSTYRRYCTIGTKKLWEKLKEI